MVTKQAETKTTSRWKKTNMHQIRTTNKAHGRTYQHSLLKGTHDTNELWCVPSGPHATKYPWYRQYTRTGNSVLAELGEEYGTGSSSSITFVCRTRERTQLQRYYNRMPGTLGSSCSAGYRCCRRRRIVSRCPARHRYQITLCPVLLAGTRTAVFSIETKVPVQLSCNKYVSCEYDRLCP